jgi:Tripartite tricarboxylate transporter TctB family
MSTKVLMHGRVLTSLVMLAIFVLMTLLAMDFPTKARLMPLMVGIPAVLLGLLQLVMEYRAVSRSYAGDAVDAHQSPDKPEKEGQKDENQMILWITLFFTGIVLFGFVTASPVLVFCFLYFGSKESIKISLISAVSTWAVIYFTFVVWFQMSLFSGLILEWLFG